MAGYSTKGNAKTQLTSDNSGLIQGRDYVINPPGKFMQTQKWTSSGRSSDSLFLTTNAFKDFCQQARTAQGKVIRQYFIAVENEWRKIKNLSTSDDRDRELELAQVELEKLKLEKEKSLGELEKKKEILQLDKDKSLAELELQKEIAQIELEKQKQITEVEKRKTHSKHIDDLCYQYNLLDTRGRPDLVKYNAFRRRVFGYLPQIAEYINDEFSISSNNSNNSN
jgi:phage anti-repressor protein